MWMSTQHHRSDDLNIYSMASLAIVMSYFSVGVALELLYTPIAYYLIDDLGAESGVYTVWVILVTLPWSFKVFICYYYTVRRPCLDDVFVAGTLTTAALSCDVGLVAFV